jgi:hypothetical protein
MLHLFQPDTGGIHSGESCIAPACHAHPEIQGAFCSTRRIVNPYDVLFDFNEFLQRLNKFGLHLNDGGLEGYFVFKAIFHGFPNQADRIKVATTSA